MKATAIALAIVTMTAFATTTTTSAAAPDGDRARAQGTDISRQMGGQLFAPPTGPCQTEHDEAKAAISEKVLQDLSRGRQEGASKQRQPVLDRDRAGHGVPVGMVVEG